jgi:hypothetical protein
VLESRRNKDTQARQAIVDADIGGIAVRTRGTQVLPSMRRVFGEARFSLDPVRNGVGPCRSIFAPWRARPLRCTAALPDLSPYRAEFGGAVLNTTIDRVACGYISWRDDGGAVFRTKDSGVRRYSLRPRAAASHTPPAPRRLRAYDG